MAINFPNSPIGGNTYDYLGIRYTYVDSGGGKGYWHVTTPGTVGVASAAEIDAGAEAIKYMTPKEHALSKYAGLAGISNTPTGFVTATDGQAALNQIASKIGRKNYIINGNFDVWQRGITVTTPNGEFISDRWVHDTASSGGAAIVSRRTFALGQTDVPKEPAFYLRIDQTTAMGNVSGTMQQKIESVRTLAGRQVTLSFYAKAAVAKTFDLEARQFFGSGSTPSSTVITDIGDVALTTSWQKFTFTFTLPSISGKSLGSDANDFLTIRLFEQAVSTFTLDIAQVQLEEGNLATDFEHRPIGEELALCQRYYSEESTVAVGHPIYNSTVTLERRAAYIFPQTMRVAPTVTVSYSSGYTGAPTLVYNRANGTLWKGTPTSNATYTQLTGYTADAEL